MAQVYAATAAAESKQGVEREVDMSRAEEKTKRKGGGGTRGAVKEGARKSIGDTGLLDHLLKHTKDKVTPDGAQRLRRRHNADGAMEYWLEPAGLAAQRREAGVADPY